MEKNLIKKVVFIVLAVLISICLFSGVAFADTAPIDINSLETIGESTTNTGTSAPINEVPTTQNTVPEVTNSSTITNNTVANTTELPHTGSNTGIVFVIGITILAGITIYIYRKTKIF